MPLTVHVCTGSGNRFRFLAIQCILIPYILLFRRDRRVRRTEPGSYQNRMRE